MVKQNQTDSDELRSKIDEFSKTNEQLTKELENLEKSKILIAENLTESESVVEKLTAEISEKSVALDQLARELSQSQEEKSEISSSRDSAENLLASRVSEIESERDQITIEKGALELGLKNVQQEKTALQPG